MSRRIHCEANTISGSNGLYDKTSLKSITATRSARPTGNRFIVRSHGLRAVRLFTWGESIAFRVGDVVNPQDLSWNFGFANLEQSRMPIWMFHPIFGLPELGSFGASFIEGIWAPAWQPLYDGVSYADQR